MLTLDEIASKESNITGFNGKLTKYRHWAIEPYFLQVNLGLAYDVGAGEGANLSFLSGYFKKVVAIEPAKKYYEIAKSRNLPNVHLINSIIEDVDIQPEMADFILATCVLEHVVNTVVFLDKVFYLLKQGGTFIAIVPNAKSLHRRIGLSMGLIKDLHELGPHDHAFGHQRYYDSDKLCNEVVECRMDKLSFYQERGIMLKPFPNDKMDKLPEDYCDALFDVGWGFPELCAEIMIVVRKK